MRVKNILSNRGEGIPFSFYFFKKGGVYLSKKENTFQAEIIEDLKFLFPSCIVIKNDSGYIQGIPDLLILYKHTWAALEVKKGLYAKRQPNQDYYIELLDGMSFASFICPENKREVLHGLQQTFSSRISTRFS